MIRSFALALATMAPPLAACAQTPQAASALHGEQATAQEQELIELSRQKWLWMADRNIEELAKLFDDKSIFVHMSRTMTKPQELDVIRTGDIQYQRADIKEVSVRFIGDTAIVLSRIELHAMVRGNVAVNPFSVTETFVKVDGAWKLGALAFSRLSTPS